MCFACKEADRQYRKSLADYEDHLCDVCKEADRQYFESLADYEDFLEADRQKHFQELAEDACKTEEEHEFWGADPTPIDMVKTEEEGEISGADPTPIDMVKTEEDALDLPSQECTRVNCSVCMGSFVLVSGVVWHTGCGEEAGDVPAAACLLVAAEGASVGATALFPQPVVFAHIKPASQDQGLFLVNCMTCLRPFSVLSANISHFPCIAPSAGDVACSDDECEACYGTAVVEAEPVVEAEAMAVGEPVVEAEPVGIAQRLVMRRRSIAFRVKTIHRIRKF